MMKMRMNFVMGNVCDRLERVDKRGNEAGTSTQDVRKVGADLKLNNGALIMKILRRTLMILVNEVLRMRP
jgi:hypothetical protein